MPSVSKEILDLAEIKLKCLTDKMYLSKVLGCDFQEEVHKELFANYIEYDRSKPFREQSEIKNRLILWSRGFFKTTSIIVEIIQLILNFPNITILLMQATVPNSKDLLDQIKKHFDGTDPQSKLRDYFPEYCQLTKRLGTSMYFTVPNRTVVSKDPTVKVGSPRSNKAGQHYDVGFFDDLVNEVNFTSSLQIKKVIQDFSFYTPLVNPGGYRFVTGTRYAFGDLYETIMRWNDKQSNWKITIKPCWRLDNEMLVSNFPPKTLPDGRIIGISVEELLAKQAEDPEMFASQYLNQPVVATRHLFPQQLLITHVLGEAPAFGHKTLFIDFASGRDKKSDHSVVLCGAQDSMNKIYCIDGIGGSWSPDQTANAVMNMALKHRPIRILIERSAAGENFVYYLKEVARQKGLNLPMEYIVVSTKPDAKHMRIALCSGFLKNNKLWFLAGLPCWETMYEQFLAYPRTKHDDYPDTIALMCEHYQAVLPTPKVMSIGDYIMKDTTPMTEYILNNHRDQNSDLPTMGSDF